jgi:hypothetical protein
MFNRLESVAQPAKKGSQTANQMFFAFPVKQLTVCFTSILCLIILEAKKIF